MTFTKYWDLLVQRDKRLARPKEPVKFKTVDAYRTALEAAFQMGREHQASIDNLAERTIARAKRPLGAFHPPHPN